MSCSKAEILFDNLNKLINLVDQKKLEFRIGYYGDNQWSISLNSLDRLSEKSITLNCHKDDISELFKSVLETSIMIFN